MKFEHEISTNEVDSVSNEQIGSNEKKLVHEWKNKTSQISIKIQKIFGGVKIQKYIRLTASALVFWVIALFVLTWLNAEEDAKASAQTQLAAEVLMHSQRIGKASPNAIQGNQDAFNQLRQSRSAINEYLNVLTRGGVAQGRDIPEADEESRKQLNEIQAQWSRSDQAAVRIMNLEKQLVGFKEIQQKLNKLSPNLLEISEQIATLNAQIGATPREISASGQLVMLTQRLGKSLNEFMTSDGINPETAFQLGKDANTFKDIVSGFLEGSAVLRLPVASNSDVRLKLNELQQSFSEYQQLVTEILKNLDKFIAAKEAERLIFNENEILRDKLQILQRGYLLKQNQSNWTSWGMLVTGVITLSTMIALGLILLRQSRLRTMEAEQRQAEAEKQKQAAIEQEEKIRKLNQQNQAAILRLMNELQEVSDGNLTIQATVSEDITGAIADSVNFMLEELRTLLDKVTQMTQRVALASEHSQQISTESLTLAAHQATEIQQTGRDVLQMTKQIHQVSQAATASTEVAKTSLTAAKNGEAAVQLAIKGMYDIRDLIQETSKRIKRLSESSLEIGDITELITDITEQTNVLALNAAIQAASAGEAGRGFAVVAEEVQRLAERSGEAAKQISALVQTIQTDAHDAVMAMEKSTQGVVEGARLSDSAGTVLAEIRHISQHLAELIHEISNSTLAQSSLADGVAKNIDSILTITERTRNGTTQTANAVHELLVLAEELKSAVARFRIA